MHYRLHIQLLIMRQELSHLVIVYWISTACCCFILLESSSSVVKLNGRALQTIGGLKTVCWGINAGLVSCHHGGPSLTCHHQSSRDLVGLSHAVNSSSDMCVYISYGVQQVSTPWLTERSLSHLSRWTDGLVTSVTWNICSCAS